MNTNKYLPFLITLFVFSNLITCAQQFWAAGFTENLDTINNGQILIQPLADTILVQDFNTYVQFESTMAGIYDDNGDILFYTNGCHLYNKFHEIIPNGENLNPGEIHDLVCDDYGYIAPKGATIVRFDDFPNLYILIHTGVENSISHSVNYGPLYMTQIDYNPSTEKLSVISKNEIIIDAEIDPFEIIKHGNGRDWWIITNQFGTANYHKILLSPYGIEEHTIQTLGYDFPFPPCRWQRSLSASPSGERLVRFSSRCGVQFLNFDRCNGELAEAGFSYLEDNIYAGGGSVFSKNSDYVYFSWWYQIIKVAFQNPPDTLNSSFIPELGFGASFSNMYRDPSGRIFIHPQAAEPYLHLIENDLMDEDTALVSVEGLKLNKRIQHTIPHYPNEKLGPLENSVCDSLLVDNIIELDVHKKLNLFPNPTNSSLKIITQLKGEKEFRIFDAYGKVLKKMIIISNETDLDVSDFPTGIYFISIYQNGYQIDSGNFLKA